MIQESVTPEGLRSRADIVRQTWGDESCARHLELAADEIAKLKSDRTIDDPQLEAHSYRIDTNEKSKETRIIMFHGVQCLPLAYCVLQVEETYNFADHILREYDKLEGIK